MIAARLAPFFCLLAACVHSDYRGDYVQHGHVSYGDGQILRHSHQTQWRESGHMAPAVDLHLRHGGQSLHLQQAPPAPPPVIYVYPAPAPQPAAPYIRSERRYIPAQTYYITP